MADETQKTFWQRFWNDRLPEDQRIVIGFVLTFAIVMLVGWQALREPRRMEVFTAQYDARAVQRGAGLFASNCVACHGQRGEGLPGVAPALNAPDMFDGSRLESIGFTGSLESYIEGTIAAGRPVRSADWPQPMPTWSQEFGGPMRPDQIRDLTAFVMNWGCYYDPQCINPTEAVLLEHGGAPPTATPEIQATAKPERTIDEIVAALPEGDAQNGEALFSGTYPCSACHAIDGTAGVGPAINGVKDRAPAGYPSIEHYLVESIWFPNAFTVEGFSEGTMPGTFFDSMSDQDLADIIAYLLTLD